MRQIGRRDFLKYCIGSAAVLGLDWTVVGRLQKALAEDGNGLPTVVWLNGANCTGCTVSLANRISSDSPKDIADLLINYIDLAFHPNLMGGCGDLAVESLINATTSEPGFILAVDGGIPTAFDGHTCILWSEGDREITAKEALLDLAPKALATLCIGTCSSFGGIPAGSPNPTGIKSVSELTGVSTINIPGCPTHPDWIVWTVAQLLAGVTPDLDRDGRPAFLFRGESRNVHKRCLRREREEADTFGQEGYCLEELGCKGERTQGDCPTRLWNGGTNWCIGANSICLGCTEAGFPDEFSPFYNYESEDRDRERDREHDEENEREDDHDHDTDKPRNNYAITKAEWNSDKKKLKIEGKGEKGATVVIKSANTETKLGSERVDSKGKWKFKLKKPSQVPCRILVESEGRTLTRDVKNAPGNCS